MIRSGKRRRSLTAVTIFFTVLVAAAAVGCSSRQSGTVGASPNDLDPSATLRVASLAPTSTDPHRSTTGFDIIAYNPAYETLVSRGADDSELPGLAQSWTFSPDGTQLTFKLRQGVKFHDGTAFDAAAAKTNLDWARTKPESTARGDFAAIKNVEAVDAQTLRLEMSQPSAAMTRILSGPPGMMISPAALAGGADLTATMVGTGPYKLAAFQPGRKLSYERFDGYWDPANAAKAAKIEMTVTSDHDARLNALRAGQIDVAQLTQSKVAAAKQSGLQIQTTGGLGFTHFQMNRSKAPFDNKLVRQALNFAIDRDAIVGAVSFGFGKASTEPFPPGYIAYSDKSAGLYRYDPARARDLLAQAGQTAVTFDAVVPNTGQYVSIAEAVKAQLAAVGITMNIRTLDSSQSTAAFLSGQYPVTVTLWSGSSDPRQTLQRLYAANGNTNPGAQTVPEFAQLLNAANIPLSGDAQAKALKAVTDVVVENALDVPIYTNETPLVYRKNVGGVQHWLSGYPDLRALGVARNTR